MSQDECSQYYYFEGVFSQPCNSYPIPQATVSVFFRIQDTHIEPPKLKGAP
ncbi:A-kinase anchor protein 14, partial [Operophtera brumata]